MNEQIKSRIRHPSIDRLHPNPKRYYKEINSILHQAYCFDDKLAHSNSMVTPLFYEHRAMCLNLSHWHREFDRAFKEANPGNEQRFAHVTGKLDVALALYTVVAERALVEYNRQLSTQSAMTKLVKIIDKK